VSEAPRPQPFGRLTAHPAFEPTVDGAESDYGSDGSDKSTKPRSTDPKPLSLIAAALFGCLGLMMLARLLAQLPHLDGQWASTPQGGLVVEASTDHQLAANLGKTVLSLGRPGAPAQDVNASMVHRSPRWMVDDAQRDIQIQQHEALNAALATGRVDLHFAGGAVVTAEARPRGLSGLGTTFWLLSAAALIVFLLGCAVFLANRREHNACYLVINATLAVDLLAVAVETMPGLGFVGAWSSFEMPLRAVMETSAGMAIAHSLAFYPTRLPHLRRGMWIGWAVTLGLAVWAGSGRVTWSWWWLQALLVGLSVLVWCLARHSYRVRSHPYALALQRFAVVCLSILMVMGLGVLVARQLPNLAPNLAVTASASWYLFVASLLAWAPFLSGNRNVLGSLGSLAGIAIFVLAVGLLLEIVFSVQPLLIALAGLLAVGLLYRVASGYFLNRILGGSRISTEGIFDQLYQGARELQSRPERYQQVLTDLLKVVFDPLKAVQHSRTPKRARVVSSGARLVVPIGASPTLPDQTSPLTGHPLKGHKHALVLSYAEHGRRLFTDEDARLAQGIVEQLHRAVAYDQAVERGRTEERLRIAQDLHDDIGARLLTLMYKSPTPEMEDYIRHTLQDLKTLTRGLASSTQNLSHAAGEWKADLTQRLHAANAELVWAFNQDKPLRLSVVQWSSLTRILRELVTNALYHGRATRVVVNLELVGRQVTLRVEDNGSGKNPAGWSHGLGLGGVRKRAKAMGGQVSWSEAAGGGIVCVLVAPDFV
jgi:signal transduction histidine kinase